MYMYIYISGRWCDIHVHTCQVSTFGRIEGRAWDGYYVELLGQIAAERPVTRHHRLLIVHPFIH